MNMSSEKMNIATIAKLAGTSIMTVSRVLNNKPDVAEATRHRILAVMREHHYKPHAVARKLSGANSQIIGVALYTEGHPLEGLYVNVFQGLQAELTARDYDLLILGPSAKDEYGDKILRTSLLDGLVLMGYSTSYADIDMLRAGSVPFLTIGYRSHDGYTPPFVAPDYKKAFQEALDYAWLTGARDIGVIISGTDEHPSNTDRQKGIRASVQMNGIPDDQVSIIHSSGRFDDGYRDSLNVSHYPDAVVLDSSEYSFGYVLGLREKGLRVPADILLIGIDYQDMMIRRCGDVLGTTLPQWTISWMEVGKLAARQLLALIEGTQSGEIHDYVDFTSNVNEGVTFMT